MSSRVLTALGVVAVAVAVVALGALALAAVDSKDGMSKRVGPRIAVVEATVTHPAKGQAPAIKPPTHVQPPTPTKPAAEQASQDAAEIPTPIPATTERPAEGPSYAIAQLRPGARLPLWSSPGSGYVETLGPKTEFGSKVVLSVVRATPRWLGVDSADLPDGTIGWIRRAPRLLQIYWTPYSLHANLSALRLTLRYGDEKLARFTVSVGAPGTETPTGRFAITDAISFDESPFYGCCALALSGRQTHLPAGWIGGDRLAIHGTPGPVGGAESHGCIRATDATMEELFRRVPLGTPVFVSG